LVGPACDDARMKELLGVAMDTCQQLDGTDPGFLGAV
jgi:hypothetical protein